jgi:hypothetical protein
MEFQGDSPSNVIEKVKYALGVAEARAGKVGLGYSLGSVLLEMTVVQSKDVKGGLKLKIPYVDLEVGTDAGIAREKTQIISIKLVPEPIKPVEADSPIDIPLADALVEVAAIVQKAYTSEPKLVLGEGSVTLQFVLTKNGSLSLIGVEAAASNATTHKLVVNLAPISS